MRELQMWFAQRLFLGSVEASSQYNQGVKNPVVADFSSSESILAVYRTCFIFVNYCKDEKKMIVLNSFTAAALASHWVSKVSSVQQ